jgi:uncharacterized small protein (DUF1192 family)
MSTAAHSANYRRRQRDRLLELKTLLGDVTLLQVIQELKQQVTSLLAEVARLRAERDVTQIEQNQRPRQLPLLVEPRAHVEDISPKLGFSGKKKPKTPPIIPPTAEFETWWAGWPHKVGKKPAMAEYTRARRKVSAEVLMAGVEKYICNKPAEWQWCGPARWLKDERWNDQPAKQPLQQARINSRQYGAGGGCAGLFGG